MKIGFSVGESSEYFSTKVEEIRSIFPDIDFEIYKTGCNKDYSDVDALFVTRLNKEDLLKACKLTNIFVPYTGVNGFPLDEIKKRNIIISNSHAKAKIVAERAMALTLASMGRIIEYHQELKNGVWHTRKYPGDYWNSLYNKKCGIYGFGHIGRQLAKLLKPFDCKIYSLNRHEDSGECDYYVDNIEVLAESVDILFVCVPLSDETKGSIDRNILSKMKDKFLINVSRGRVVEEEALYWALNENILAGAGLDAWYIYPENGSELRIWPSNYPIQNFKNVVMSPHAASHAIEAKRDYLDDTFDNLVSFLRTGEIRNIVDLDNVKADTD